MIHSNSQREVIRQSFLKEAEHFRYSSPLFSALARASAQDQDIVEVARATRPGQSPGQLLLCVVQYLLLRTPNEKLGQYFPSVTDTPLSSQEAFGTYREFCLDRRAEVEELLSWRTVNTNLVEKSSTLLPAIRHIDRLSEEPLTLLEICCSAGMNLLFDEYHYDYGTSGRLGPENSPVQLGCKIVGNGGAPIDSMPRIAQRLGVDLVKVDPTSATDRVWMEAVLFPEWTKERERLRAALSIRAARELKTIIGDALNVLPSLLDELPGQLCILQTYCIKHWSEPAKVGLEELLCEAGRRRDIHKLTLEMPDSEPPQVARDRLSKLAAAGIPILHKSFPSRIEHTWYAKGGAQTQLLGQGDGFGVWLDWQV